MYSDSDLDRAVTGGVFSPDQAAAFRAFVAGGRPVPMVDEEHFRLLTGFNDIFVSLAALILLVAVGWIGQYVPPYIDNGDGPSLMGPLFIAGTAWGLAEFFTLKRRMALPSILLLLAFVGGVFFTVVLTLVTIISAQGGEPWMVPMVFSVGAAAAAAAAWLHWRRFKVPITVAAGTAAAVGLLLCLFFWALAGDVARLTEDDVDRMRPLIEGAALILGLATFVFAMWWDGSDRRRLTRRSDVAFWLHLLAAPLIVHPVFSLLGLTDGEASVGSALVVILLYIALAGVALAIDRRAILVSALAYVLYAINALFRQSGAVELSVALTALVIGSALLLLSAFWPNARRAVVGPLSEGLKARLPVLDRPTTRVVAA